MLAQVSRQSFRSLIRALPLGMFENSPELTDPDKPARLPGAAVEGRLRPLLPLFSFEARDIII